MSERVCYRYRTCVLVGPWRERREMAADDAIAARLARRDETGTLAWKVRGEIEESRGDQAGLGRDVRAAE